MLTPLLSFIIAFVIPPLLIIISWVLSARSNQDREKLSPFECGFEPNSSARLPFSLRFFLLAVIFLVFDIEIVLLFPTPLLISLPSVSPSMLGVLLFIFILLVGLLHEWNEGSLNWSK